MYVRDQRRQLKALSEREREGGEEEAERDIEREGWKDERIEKGGECACGIKVIYLEESLSE